MERRASARGSASAPILECGRTRVPNSSLDRSSRVRFGPGRRVRVSRTAEVPPQASTVSAPVVPAVPFAREVRADLSSAGLPTGTVVPGRRAADPRLFSEPSAAARPSVGVPVLSSGVAWPTASPVPAVSGVRLWRAYSTPEGLPARMAAYGRNAGGSAVDLGSGAGAVASGRVGVVAWRGEAVLVSGAAPGARRSLAPVLLSGSGSGGADDCVRARRCRLDRAELSSARLRGFVRALPHGYPAPPRAMS